MSQYLALLFNMAIVAISGGVVFISLAQPSYTRQSRLFIGMWFALILWAMTNFMVISQEFRLALSTQNVININASALIVSIFLYYVFFVEKTQTHGPIRNLTILLSILVVTALIMIWMNQAYKVESFETFQWNTEPLSFTWIGYLLISGLSLFLMLVFWSVMSASDSSMIYLRLPSLMLLVAFLIMLIPPIWPKLISNFVIVLATARIAWIVLKDQLFSPLASLTDELQIANRDLKQAINELAREKKQVDILNKELEKANEQKTNFLATMSHELRTPLNSIVGYSQLLTQQHYGTLNDQQLDRLTKIQRNGENLLKVITNILDLSKIYGGRLDLNMKPLNIKAILENIVNAVKPMCDEKGLELRVSMPDHFEEMAGDEIRIYQVVNNLVDNAIKFTNAGTITISAENITVNKGKSETFRLPILGWLSDGPWLILKVIDTGIGIAPENQALIFEEFSQVDSSRTREFEGTGLGLAITRLLVELHGGSIWVRSQLGEGSSFFVALPLSPQEKQIDYDNHNVLGKAAS